MSDTRYSVASLFCGAGGLDVGFMESNFSITFAADIDPAAQLTFARNIGVCPSDTDLREFDAANIRGYDVITAGPPCQGFSPFRKQGGSDSRNGLFVRTAELIASARPRLFVIENVRGVLAHANGRFASWAIRILESVGLVVRCFDIECGHFGVPQRRRRIILLGGTPRFGTRAILDFERQWRLLKQREPTTVGEALSRLPSNGKPRIQNHQPRHDVPEWYAGVFGHIAPGQKLCDTRRGPSSVHSWEIPSVFGSVSKAQSEVLEELARLRRQKTGRRYKHFGDGRPVTMRQLCQATKLKAAVLTRHLEVLEDKNYIRIGSDGYVDLARKFNGRFKRLHPLNPSPAVTNDFRSPRTTLHPSENRGLTVRECARLQGFADSFVFDGSIDDQYHLVANAVPPPVSRILAASLAKALWRRASA